MRGSRFSASRLHVFFDDRTIGLANQFSIESVLEPVRIGHQFPEQKALVHLCKYCLHTGKILLPPPIFRACPDAQHYKPANQN